MTRHDIRTHVITTAAAALFTTAAGSAFAQGPPVAGGRPETSGSTSCLLGSRTVRTATGGILGGWLGFVAAKIRMSDWNDATHTSSATRTRNQMTIGGAIIGAIGASLIHVNKNCSGNVPVGAPPRSSRQIITADEIARSGVSGSVYDVVYSLRRTWLNIRGLNSGSEAMHQVASAGVDTLVTVSGEIQLIVYLDNVKLGDLTELRRLSTAGVTSIHYYEPAEANYLWGMDHSHGAIQVVTLDRQEVPPPLR
ncbi:MAG TPA: hypothetical protein VGM82_21595 [Gemmatimonadaceae bacterium]|jgi:hypothetical protein